MPLDSATTTPAEQVQDITLGEQAQAVLDRLDDPEGIAFWTFLQQHQKTIMKMVSAYQSSELSYQQQAAAATQEVTRLRRFVKNYFAEFLLASMYLVGMFLAVIYLLAHTWR